MRHWRVAIIGAGFGGLGMAVQLKQAGIDDFVVFEKGSEVGGIWQWNTYPGCGCDVPSHLYSFSFARYRNAQLRYPKQPAILDYLCRVADDFDLRPHIWCDMPITSAVWHGTLWVLRSPDGFACTADAVIFAVGQLHRPYTPELPGTFFGSSFHTAHWDHDLDLTGKSVAVIGTGSSAAQLVPQLAKIAGQVDVYQRTPNWVLPKPAQKFSHVTAALLRWIPGLHTAYRVGTWLAADTLLTPVVTRGWTARPLAWLARWHLHRQVPDAALRAALTPQHEIGCKRIVIDSDYYPALCRPNVELIAEPIKRLTETGVVTTDGWHHYADALIYATGFKTSEFLVPLDVRGRDGIDLQEQWHNGAEAYLGMTLPGFPNMFLVHGPNTILGHNSNIFMIECQTRYILRCLESSAVEVTAEAMEGYRRWLANNLRHTVWQGSCRSWYKTATGRVVNPWPASTRRYRAMTRCVITKNYHKII
jgi:cation diffusion facilitator CzcD-associated flavoprotein CzcO